MTGGTAGVYVRLSIDREDQTSTERQEANARAKAAALAIDAYPPRHLLGRRHISSRVAKRSSA